MLFVVVVVLLGSKTPVIAIKLSGGSEAYGSALGNSHAGGGLSSRTSRGGEQPAALIFCFSAAEGLVTFLLGHDFTVAH